MITAAFKLDLGGMESGVKRVGEFFFNLKNILSPVAAGVGVVKDALSGVASGMASGVKSAMDEGGRLSDVSAQTGIAVKDLMVLEQAFKNAGVSAEQVGPAVNRLQRALTGVNEDGEPTNATLKLLGVNMAELSDLDPSSQFTAVSKAIAGIDDPAQRAAAAMGVFGRSGGELLALFSDENAMGDAAEHVGKQAEIMDRNASLFDKISDQLGLTGVKMQGFFVGVAAGIAPLLEPIMDWFASADLAGIGERVGAAIGGVVKILTDGSLYAAFGSYLALQVGKVVNVLWGGVLGVAYTLGSFLQEAFRTALMWFEVLTTADFWKGMGAVLLGIAQNFVATIMEKMADLMDGLSGIPLFGDKIGAGAENLRTVATGFRSFGGENEEAGNGLLAGFAETIVSRYAEAFGNIKDAFGKGVQDGEVFPIEALEENLGNEMAQILRAFETVAPEEGSKASQKHAEKGRVNDVLDKEDQNDKRGNGPSATRMMTLAGFSGVFVKDPLAAERRRQTELLEVIAKNTAKENRGVSVDPVLRLV